MTPPAAAAPAVRARTAAPARPLRSAPKPRRVSGPATGKPASAPSPARRTGTPADGGVALGVLGALQHLSRHRLLDRLIRGRAWIGFVAFALIGIVTLQLGLLKLNAGIGRSLESSALLQRENASLSIENSELAAGNRVESNAAHLGMQLVPAGALQFLTSRPHADIAKAAGSLASASSTHTSTAGGEQGTTPATSSSTASPSESSGAGEASTAESSTSGEQAPTGESAASSTTAAAPNSTAVAPPSATGEGTAPSGESAATGTVSAPSPAPSTIAGTPESTPAGGTQAAPGG
jgi:hypothetical protein